MNSFGVNNNQNNLKYVFDQSKVKEIMSNNVNANAGINHFPLRVNHPKTNEINYKIGINIFRIIIGK